MMMPDLVPFLIDWLNLLVRWVHVALAIGWIASSLYFIAVDRALRERRPDENVPRSARPERVPGFAGYRWEAGLTWVTGFVLLVLIYYLHADEYLVQRDVLDIPPAVAIVMSLLSVAIGVFIYDRLCRSDLRFHAPTLAGAVFVLILMAALFYSRTYSGRGAFIHVGVLIGSIMAFNVLRVILPAQRNAAAMTAGRPGAELAAEAAIRSAHNDALTLPVIIFMLSNHYPLLIQASGYSWLVAGLIVVVGAAVRHFLNRHDAGDPFAKSGWAIAVAAVALAGAIYLTQASTIAPSADSAVSEAEALAIVNRHCVMCHADRPTHQGLSEPPLGVVLTSSDNLRRHSAQILEQAVFSDNMPIGNETGMTAIERQRLGAFLRNN